MTIKRFAMGLSRVLLVPATLLVIGSSEISVAVAQKKLYNPVTLPANDEIKDTLTEKDIPTGEGGFARDYIVKFNQGDNIAIDLKSDSFDAILSLMTAKGATIAENDDGPDGTTNSLLFTRVKDTGTYIIRVQSFGETGFGPFTLRVSRLRPE